MKKQTATTEVQMKTHYLFDAELLTFAGSVTLPDNELPPENSTDVAPPPDVRPTHKQVFVWSVGGNCWNLITR